MTPVGKMLIWPYPEGASGPRRLQTHREPRPRGAGSGSPRLLRWGFQALRGAHRMSASSPEMHLLPPLFPALSTPQRIPNNAGFPAHILLHPTPAPGPGPLSGPHYGPLKSIPVSRAPPPCPTRRISCINLLMHPRPHPTLHHHTPRPSWDWELINSGILVPAPFWHPSCPRCCWRIWRR